MKNIFTLALSFILVYGLQAQNSIRIVDVSDTRIAVQMRLGEFADLPGMGTTDVCDIDTSPENSSEGTAGDPGPVDDVYLSEPTFALVWSDASIEGFSIVNEFPNINGNTCPSWPGSNEPACVCSFSLGVEVPGLGFVCATQDTLTYQGGGYGIEQFAPVDEGGGQTSQGFGGFDSDCTFSGWIPSAFQWESDEWYTVVVLDVNMAPQPPGVEPLALTDMIEIDPGPGNGGITTFSPNLSTGNWTLAMNDYELSIVDAPLPLSLISFDANKEGEKSAKLEWTTANEIDTKVFIIERSTDREIWEDVAGLEAAGNSSGIVEYSFIDKNVYTGRTERQTFYYRLRMVDQDDSFTYSNIDVVSFSNTFGEEENGFKLFVFPNPAKDGFNVEINQANDENPITRLELLDITGRVVYSRDIDSGSLMEYVDFSRYNVTAGTYVLKASDSAGAMKTHEKIIVTR